MATKDKRMRSSALHGLEVVQRGVGRLGRMVDGMQLFELANGHLSVNLRCRYVGMAKLLLDKADIHAGLMHERCHGMTKQVATATLADVGLLDVVAHKLGQPVDCERLVANPCFG